MELVKWVYICFLNTVVYLWGLNDLSLHSYDLLWTITYFQGFQNVNCGWKWFGGENSNIGKTDNENLKRLYFFNSNLIGKKCFCWLQEPTIAIHVKVKDSLCVLCLIGIWLIWKPFLNENKISRKNKCIVSYSPVALIF